MVSVVLLFAVDFFVRLSLFSKLTKRPIKKGLLIGGSVIVGLIALMVGKWFLYLDPLVLVAVALWQGHKWSVAQYVFYCLLPFSVIDLYHKMSGIYELKAIIFDFPDDSLDVNLIIIIFFLSFLLWYSFLTKILRLDIGQIGLIFTYSHLRKLILALNLSMLFYAGVLHFILVWSGEFNEASFSLAFGDSVLTVDLLLLQMIVFVGAVIYFNFTIKEILAKELEESKEKQLGAMISYSSHIEELYKEIRSFRHDYTNLLISLHESIKQKDMEAVECIYQSVLSGSDKAFREGKYNIANLANLEDMAMKSIVSAKMLEAQNKGLNVSVEVAEKIGSPDQLEPIDFLKILSIFLDNAIEASLLSTQSVISFAYFKEQDKTILVIENSTKEERVNTKTIFEYGNSSKGGNRGIGLANVKAILAKYPDVCLLTTSSDHLFRQEIQFDNKSSN